MLPDLLAPNLLVVFCGTAVATASAERGHYYAGRGNKFWQLLHDAGFTPRLLRPEDDRTLPSYGIGITDLVKEIAQSHDRGLDYGRAGEVAAHLVAAAPQWIAFNGLTAGRAAAVQLRVARRKDVTLGGAGMADRRYPGLRRTEQQRRECFDALFREAQVVDQVPRAGRLGRVAAPLD